MSKFKSLMDLMDVLIVRCLDNVELSLEKYIKSKKVFYMSENKLSQLIKIILLKLVMDL